MGSNESLASPRLRKRSMSDGHLNERSWNKSKLLSNFRKQQIVSSWRVAQKHELTIGQRVFIRTFKHRPELQQLYAFRDKKFAHLKSDPEFKAHTTIVQTELDKVVNNLDHLEQMESYLFRLGLRHAQICEQLQSTCLVLAEHWDAMAEAIVFCVTEGQKFPGLYGAWRVLICWMMSHMRDGLMSHHLLSMQMPWINMNKKGSRRQKKENLLDQPIKEEEKPQITRIYATDV